MDGELCGCALLGGDRLEHGSTSMALLLFLICFSAERLFPLGLAVVILQALLLAVLESKARTQWLSRNDTPP